MNRVRAVAFGVTGVLVAVGVGVAAVGFGGGGGGPAATRSPLPPATAPVERTTLTETQRVDGTLGYGTTRTATGGGGRGTLTWLPRPGSVISRGGTAYRVDDRPVPLLYGSLPLYRTLSTGTVGADVRQFERNLRALGYTGFTVDRTYGSATAAAIRRWQDDLGLKETGRITPGSVLIVPSEIRVAEHKADVGGTATGPVLTYTGTTRVVHVNLDVQYQRLARKGARASIELPDGGTTQGTITRVGKVATEAKDGDGSTTIDVTIAVRRQRSLGSYDKAPVDVHLIAARHRNVLAVPIAALLARGDGGYSVQVVEGGSVRTIAVETGVFTSGKVEISGSGISAGMKVGVPE